MGERHTCIPRFSSQKSRISAQDRLTEPAVTYFFLPRVENGKYIKQKEK